MVHFCFFLFRSSVKRLLFQQHLHSCEGVRSTVYSARK